MDELLKTWEQVNDKYPDYQFRKETIKGRRLISDLIEPNTPQKVKKELEKCKFHNVAIVFVNPKELFYPSIFRNDINVYNDNVIVPYAGMWYANQGIDWKKIIKGESDE